MASGRRGLTGLAAVVAVVCAVGQGADLPGPLALVNASGEAARAVFNDDGTLRFWGAPPQAGAKSGAATADPVAGAWSFLETNGALLGIRNVTAEIRLRSVELSGGASYVRFNQSLAGVPVFGATILVHVDSNGDIASMLSDIARDTSAIDSGALAMAPTLSAAAASSGVLNNQALRKRAEGQGTLEVESEPKLVVYAPVVFNREGALSLCWYVVVGSATSPAFREALLVDAHSGWVVRHYSLIYDAKNRLVYDANNTFNDPGTLRRSEGQAASGIVDVDEAYDFLGNTYDFFFNEHGRDSINNAGMVLNATVRFGPMSNAFWDGSRMYFDTGFATDDVTAHELTHGVTQYESNLIYMDESGALNESFSDVWGEFVDLTNGLGTDTPEVRWLMGEDVTGLGAIRDMQDPTTFGDPDRYYSPYYYYGSGDGGGVHSNSGVNNKLCYLLTDGDTFNGRTITGLGISAVADLYYECQANLLTDASGYADLYTQMSQAAINLGYSQAQRDTIERACRAVQIGGLPEAPSDFTATTAAADPNIGLSWSNPAKAFNQVVLVRKQGTYPGSPTDGTVVYSGAGTSFTDGPLTVDERYYYSLYAYHGLDEFGDESYSPPVRKRVRVGLVPPTETHTEAFYDADNDLDNSTVTFTPAEAPTYYLACAGPASALPTEPSGGTILSLTDDSAATVSLTGGKTVKLYGKSYGTVYVGSNGYITFDGPDTRYYEDLEYHFDQPRVSALFTDLFPGTGAQVSYKQLSDRLVVTWLNVDDLWYGGKDSFQLEMFFNGRITITYLQIASYFGVVGLSMGDWDSTAFAEWDVTASSQCVYPDTDGDGIADWLEGFDDFDGDSVANYLDDDSDGDGILDADETADDRDGDGAGNFLDLDADGDGISDADEQAAPPDPDGDLIPNYLDIDSDGDGMTDRSEVAFGSDPYDASSTADLPVGALSVGIALGMAAALSLRRRAKW